MDILLIVVLSLVTGAVGTLTGSGTPTIMLPVLAAFPEVVALQLLLFPRVTEPAQSFIATGDPEAV